MHKKINNEGESEFDFCTNRETQFVDRSSYGGSVVFFKSKSNNIALSLDPKVLLIQ